MSLGTLVIDRRFHGPPDSGNGGYVCGRLAAFLDAPAAVRLRVPPPLEVELDVRKSANGVLLARGDAIIAEARAEVPALSPPAPPDFAEAEAAARGYRGFERHWFPGCFVCGPHRELGDGLRIFPGPVAGRHQVACPWRPDASLSGPDGLVAPEFVWSALDCPGVHSVLPPEKGVLVLGELCASITGRPAVGEPCVLVGWEVARDRRIHTTGTALYSESGECLAVARGLWFEVAEFNGA